MGKNGKNFGGGRRPPISVFVGGAQKNMATEEGSRVEPLNWHLSCCEGLYLAHIDQ